MELNDEQASSIVEGLRAWKQGGYKDGLQLLPDGNVAGTCSTEEMMFFAALTKMATWALEHPSKRKFQYISHDNVRANESLTTAFRHWWYAEHPHYTAAQHKMFEESVNHGKCPDAVMEHTPDGHHPIGWSWGSEFVLADFYLCLTRAIIQRMERDGIAPKATVIAYSVFQLNRIGPTPEIIKAMGERLTETEETRSYGVVSGEVN